MGGDTSITRSENHELVAGGGEGLCGFFLPGEIDAAFRENKFSVVEMIEVLTDIVREQATRTTTRKDGSIIEEPVVSARERMAALTMLDKKAKEGMVLGGLIQRERLTIKKTLEDGSEAEYAAEGMRTAEEGSSRLKSTLALLVDASKSKSDKVIDVEVLDEQRDDASDGSGGRGGPSLPRQPRGSNPGTKSKRANGGSGPGVPGGGGDGVCDEGHGKERASNGEPQHVEPGAGTGREQANQGSTKGAGNERGSGVPVQSGRGKQGKGTGSEDSGSGCEVGRDHSSNQPASSGSEPDISGKERRPVVPGESSCKWTNWWEPGVPRRSPDSDPGSLRDCATAESSVDRLKRIERAREQAAAAAASYAEQRKDSKRPPDIPPVDELRFSN